LATGIDVLDPNDPTVVVGKSQAAARAAVLETSFSRAVLAAPIFFPSVALYAVERAHLMPRRPSLRAALPWLFLFLELYIAAPLAIAFYPQVGTLRVEDAEPHIKEWKDKDGLGRKAFVYNKGL